MNTATLYFWQSFVVLEAQLKLLLPGKQKMKMLILNFLLMIPFLASANFADELTTKQKNRLLAGGIVSFTKVQAGQTYSHYFAYYKNRTPKELLSLFWDYQGQATYAPMLKTLVLLPGFSADDNPKRAIPLKKFEMEYSTGCLKGSMYSEWKQMKADKRVKGTVGGARFETLGSGTLMGYYNKMEPNGVFNKIFLKLGLRSAFLSHRRYYLSGVAHTALQEQNLRTALASVSCTL